MLTALRGGDRKPPTSQLGRKAKDEAPWLEGSQPALLLIAQHRDGTEKAWDATVSL